MTLMAVLYQHIKKYVSHLLELMLNNDRRLKIVMAASENVRQFSVENVTDKWEELLRSLLSSKFGESIYDVVDCSIKSLLDPKLTASWEKGLTQVAEGTITPDEYMEKLEGFILNIEIKNNIIID